MRGPFPMPHLLWILPMLLLSIDLQAQLAADARIPFHDATESIGAFKRLDLPFDLKEREEIIINIETLAGKKLRRFSIDVPASEIDLVAKKVRRIERNLFITPREGTYIFSFINKSIGKRNIRVVLEKSPRKFSRDTIILDDIIVTTTIDTMRTAYPDTVAMPDIIEKSFVLEASRDYNNISEYCIEQALLENDYQYAVYWIGIGEEAKKEYDKLKNNPPPSWLIQGVNEPIMAYGLGLTQRLPESNSSLANNIIYKFKDPTSKADVKIARGDSKPFYYGVIPVYKAGTYKKIKLCFRNFNTTTRVQVYVKVAMFRLDKQEKLDIIKRERVQEIFIQKPIEYYKASEE